MSDELAQVRTKKNFWKRSTALFPGESGSSSFSRTSGFYKVESSGQVPDGDTLGVSKSADPEQSAGETVCPSGGTAETAGPDPEKGHHCGFNLY